MILRDVIYAEQPRTLNADAVSVPVAKVNHLVSLASTTGTVAAAAPAPMPAPIEPLTASRVTAWLATQDASTRQQVAQALADELEQLQEKAVAEGKVAGLALGQQAAVEQFKSGVAVLRALASEANELFVRQRDELTQASVDIVGEALTKLVGEALVHPKASLAAVLQAIEHISGAREVVVRVNARDLEMISSFTAEITEVLGTQGVSIVSDPRVQLGGCLVESSFGEIDARWETQLSALVRTLRGDEAHRGLL